ncbi:MAG: CynX/NimT family MFS transporter [Candidatus Omnitrophota bacterium]
MSRSKFYGWKLVAVLFFVYLSATIALVGGNIINTFMAKQLDMKRSLFGAGFALAYLLVGFVSPLAASVAKKVGERVTISIGLLMIMTGALLMSFIGNTSGGYMAGFGLIIGTGSAFATVLPIQTLITRWFERKRALATGVVLSAGGFSGIVSSLMVNHIIKSTNGNWKLAWIMIASLMGLITLVAFFFIKNTPEELGQVPDGSVNSQNDSNRAQKQTKPKVYQTPESWGLKEALGTRALWLTLLAAAAQFIGYYLCLNHGMIHLMDVGISNDLAALSPGILLFASIGGRLLSGALGDHIEPRFIIMTGLMLTLIGCIALMNAVSPFLVYVYAVTVGLGFGLVYVCLFTMLGNYFGTVNIRSFLGFLIPIVTLFGASAPLVGGIIKDRTGSYAMALTGTVVIAAVGSLLLFFARPPIKKQ